MAFCQQAIYRYKGRRRILALIRWMNKSNRADPMLFRIFNMMTLLELSHATVYRMVGRRELELVP